MLKINEGRTPSTVFKVVCLLHVALSCFCLHLNLLVVDCIMLFCFVVVVLLFALCCCFVVFVLLLCFVVAAVVCLLWLARPVLVPWR